MANTDFDQKQQRANTSILSGELAQKIAEGNSSAEGEFVGLNYRWLLFIVRRKFNQSNNHEDIVQDTFMLVIAKLKQGSVRNPQAILGFLRTAAIQIGYDYLRKDKKFTSDIDPDLMETFSDAQEDILSTLIWNDKLKFIKEMIDGLKIQRDKDILINFYLKDQSKQSICNDLDLSPAHFDRVIFRAKERLKKIIEQQGGYDEPKGPPQKSPLKPVKNKNQNNKDQNNKNNTTELKEKRIMLKIYHYVVTALQKFIKPVAGKTA